jgi:hypothetical protein
MATQGSCLCGALRFEVTGPISGMFHCHCSRCRKSHGAPFATFGFAPTASLRWLAGEDAVMSWTGGQGGGPRYSCRHCGSPAPGILPEMGIAYFPVGLLEGDPGLWPQQHLFAGSKAPWHEITDDLPQQVEYPPEWGMPTVPDSPPVQVEAGKVAGSCLCGDVAYEFTRPQAMYQCHCSRCRRARGAAHGANIFCKLDDFRWLRGEALVVDYQPPDARRFAVAFCRQCGAAVPRVAARAGIVVIPAGALDTDPGIRPTAHVFVDSKAPWFEITDSLQRYAEAPPPITPAPSG